MRITQTALKFNTTVYVLIACIIVIGAISYRTLPLEAAPEVKVPMMIVSTIYPGVSPEDMERLVTNVRTAGDAASSQASQQFHQPISVR
jgi:multidrug efflux pump